MTSWYISSPGEICTTMRLAGSGTLCRIPGLRSIRSGWFSTNFLPGCLTQPLMCNKSFLSIYSSVYPSIYSTGPQYSLSTYLQYSSTVLSINVSVYLSMHLWLHLCTNSNIQTRQTNMWAAQPSHTGVIDTDLSIYLIRVWSLTVTNLVLIEWPN